MAKKRFNKGRPTTFPTRMSPNEKLVFNRLVRKAEVEGLTLEEMEKYNLFAPELEARKFVETLVECKGEVVSAMRRMYPTYKTAPVEQCLKKGIEVCNALRVQELIKQALDKQSISVDMILSGVLEIAKAGNRDADKLKAWELLGKFKSIFNEGPKIEKNTVEYNLNISEDAARRLLGRRQKFAIGEGGEFKDVVLSGEDGGVIDGEEVIDGLHDTDAGEL